MTASTISVTVDERLATPALWRFLGSGFVGTSRGGEVHVMSEPTGANIREVLAQQPDAGIVAVMWTPVADRAITLLEAGADDVAIAPPPIELAARIRAIARRVAHNEQLQ